MNYFGDPSACIILGEAAEIGTLIEEKAASISFCKVEYDRRNSAIPLLDLTEVDARIEPGAFIREGVHIGKNDVVMMGAVINIGAEIGDGSMIDMNAVLGARAKVGRNCHVGAGAVLTGVLEPPSKEPVAVGDGVVIGANAVILEGVQIGENAGCSRAVVTQDVRWSGCSREPRKVMKEKDEKTEGKTELLDDLRG